MRPDKVFDVILKYPFLREEEFLIKLIFVSKRNYIRSNISKLSPDIAA
jgi:hypothetical protein